MRAITKENENNSGFTLIEIIIYLGLFSIVVGGFLLITYGLVQGSGQSQSKAALNEEMAFLLGKIEWALTGASSLQVQVPSPSVLEISPGVTFTFDSGAQTLSFSSVQLNSDSVTVTNLTFTEYTAAEKPDGIAIEFTLSNLNESVNASSTKYLRF